LGALGRFDATVRADHPTAAVFAKNGKKTYVVYNPQSEPQKVRFSDGVAHEAPPGLHMLPQSPAERKSGSAGTARTSSGWIEVAKGHVRRAADEDLPAAISRWALAHGFFGEPDASAFRLIGYKLICRSPKKERPL